MLYVKQSSMRKGIAEGRSAHIPLNRKSLEKLELQGFKFVLVKGLTPDHHYEHVEPHCLLLVPVRELPADPAEKDVYAPIRSEILLQWANESHDSLPVVIAGSSKHWKT
jgi:hypothetical protein